MLKANKVISHLTLDCDYFNTFKIIEITMPVYW